jgi:tRNA G18 (ribose-2'-O)-methylase SpoU
MSLQYIRALSDSRLTPYRSLKQSNLTRGSGQFIAEGMLVVERLLHSSFRAESILISERRLAILENWQVAAGIDVLIVSEGLARDLTGFNFHSGVMACGRRGEPTTIDRLLESDRRAVAGSATDRQLIVACPRMTDPDNLGGLIRIGRAFGIAGLLLGEACCDPFSRRTLRVSMGNAFDLPIIESDDLSRDLQRMKIEGGFHLTATVLESSATPLHQVNAQPRDVLLLGNEAHGLDPEWIALCDRKITIPMCGNTDSLNVTVAAGICLHWLMRASEPPV